MAALGPPPSPPPPSPTLAGLVAANAAAAAAAEVGPKLLEGGGDGLKGEQPGEPGLAQAEDGEAPDVRADVEDGVAIPEHDRAAVQVLPLAKYFGYCQQQLSPRRRQICERVCVSFAVHEDPRASETCDPSQASPPYVVQPRN